MPHRSRVQTAAAICGAAAALNVAQVAIPGGPDLSLLPGAGAAALTAILLLWGERWSSGALLAFGPVGASLIAVAVATTPAYSDAAVLYMWPAVWVAYFYGPRAIVMVVVWISAAHAVALLALPPGIASVDRWLDVTAAVTVVSGVVGWIAGRNRRLLEQLRAEARIDPLTGLLNRRGFDERWNVELDRACRYGRGLSVVAFDLDGFKAVNDEHGHEMGDRVLACFGALLAREVRAADVAARTGGEEFTVLLPETSAGAAWEFAERIRMRVASGGGDEAACGVVRDLDWTVSGGVASSDTPQGLASVLRDADRALYAAKAAGRNRVLDGAATGLGRSTADR